MSNDSLTPVFSGEVQLAGWSESHTGGCKVTLWLPSSEDLEPFRALTARKGNTAGHRFMAAFVEIGDDELPVQPHKPKVGALCLLAVQWCKDPQFWEWLETDPENAAHSEFGATECVKSICGIASRKELDTNPKAGFDFETRIRKPYMAWMKANA